jgi:hypothetical protein
VFFLRKIAIPPSVDVFAGDAFMGCTSLAEVTFLEPSRLTRLGGFYLCDSLLRIAIPPPSKSFLFLPSANAILSVKSFSSLRAVFGNWAALNSAVRSSDFQSHGP